ncbi:vacuolar protein sorting/targeting protein PEP1 [Clydaea vesicula]|uniref:Vacuolar protein sorting/targeting protein PEP1 n=1 Tax=Clydaea vesicula TaxID=447962 RepID=A0AAD5XV91_9FUNG|nr:vacuolar protein sorting/targeting protein PEP1 [Clydaea vesicula]
MFYQWLQQLILLIFPFFSLVLTEEIILSSTLFNDLPKQMPYFKDSEAILYHESNTNNVYVSKNEGKSWAKVTNVPEGSCLTLIQHAFEPQTVTKYN